MAPCVEKLPTKLTSLCKSPLALTRRGTLTLRASQLGVMPKTSRAKRSQLSAQLSSGLLKAWRGLAWLVREDTSGQLLGFFVFLALCGLVFIVRKAFFS